MQIQIQIEATNDKIQLNRSIGILNKASVQAGHEQITRNIHVGAAKHLSVQMAVDAAQFLLLAIVVVFLGRRLRVIGVCVDKARLPREALHSEHTLTGCLLGDLHTHIQPRRAMTDIYLYTITRICEVFVLNNIIFSTLLKNSESTVADGLALVTMGVQPACCERIKYCTVTMDTGSGNTQVAVLYTCVQHSVLTVCDNCDCSLKLLSVTPGRGGA
jgi:hypothetical protein